MDPPNEDCDDSVAGEDNEGVSERSLYAFYTSHALFMMNNRSYEFATVLFTAAAFPDTLVAASIRGLSAHLASVLLSPAVGQWCSRHPSRLKPVRICIVVQRLAIALACLGWIAIVVPASNDSGEQQSQRASGIAGPAKLLIFAALILCGMVARLAAVGNEIVVERDWVPLISAQEELDRIRRPQIKSRGTVTLQESVPLLNNAKPQLHLLNATIKRIDLLAKLGTPLIVSAVALSYSNYAWVAGFLASLQALSCFAEVFLTRKVWLGYRSLQLSKHGIRSPTPTTLNLIEGEFSENSSRLCSMRTRAVAFAETIEEQVRICFRSVKAYMQAPVLLPSIAFALEPFSVLTIAGSMSAYLLVAHFSLGFVTIARTASTMVEVLSTIVTPLLLTWLSRRRSTDAASATVEIEDLTKVGMMGLFWHFAALVPATAILLFVDTFESSRSSIVTAVLFASLATSRLGPFAYSLVEQQIVQIQLQEQERVEFSGVEMALVDLAELARWSIIGIFGKPDQFRWVALTSFLSVGMSLILFTVWTRRNTAL